MIGQSRDLVWFLCVCTTAFQTLTEIGSVYENEGKASRELCVCVCVCVCVWMLLSACGFSLSSVCLSFGGVRLHICLCVIAKLMAGG